MPSDGHGHGHHGPPDTSRGFEQSDISLKGLTTGVVVYFIFTGLVGVIVLVGMWIFGVNTPPPQGTNQEVGRRIPQPPNPLLQNNITARTDLWNLRAREDFLLHNYTWVDQGQGVVRVPVDQALNRAAEAGPAGIATLPTGPQGSTAAPAPTNFHPVPQGRAATPPNSLSNKNGRPPASMNQSQTQNFHVNINKVPAPVGGGLPK